jgi:DNA primase
MNSQNQLLDVALQYHDALPKRIREYLNGRGIPDEMVNSHLLGWNGWRITIPIYDRDGEVLFFRLARDPEDKRPGPKMRTSPGAKVELYGWDQVLARPQQIIICEGEFDRLVLEARGFPAVTSTAGAATFRPQWAKQLKEIEEVYICFDRDQAGCNGAAVVTMMIPHAKVVELPEEVREGGDGTDFFVHLRRGREDFLKLLEAAQPASPAPQQKHPDRPARMQRTDSLLSQRIERIKKEIPVERVIEEYVQLRPVSAGATLLGCCPFHDDRIPLLAVYPATSTFHCFGCRAHGDVISFVRAMEHLSFGQTLDILDQQLSHDEPRSGHKRKEEKAA